MLFFPGLAEGLGTVAALLHSNAAFAASASSGQACPPQEILCNFIFL